MGWVSKEMKDYLYLKLRVMLRRFLGKVSFFPKGHLPNIVEFTTLLALNQYIRIISKYIYLSASEEKFDCSNRLHASYSNFE